jgi:hypothetical protein
MNHSQRKLLRRFTLITAILIAITTAVSAYAVIQAKLSHHGDIFDRLVADKAFTWIEPTLICTTGAFLIVLVLFVGFWKSHSDSRPPSNG